MLSKLIVAPEKLITWLEVIITESSSYSVWSMPQTSLISTYGFVPLTSYCVLWKSNHCSLLAFLCCVYTLNMLWYEGKKKVKVPARAPFNSDSLTVKLEINVRWVMFNLSNKKQFNPVWWFCIYINYLALNVTSLSASKGYFLNQSHLI